MESESPILSTITKKPNTRSSECQAVEINCRTEAFFSSSIPFLARLYNQKFQMKNEQKNSRGKKKWEKYMITPHPNHSNSMMLATDDEVKIIFNILIFYCCSYVEI